MKRKMGKLKVFALLIVIFVIAIVAWQVSYHFYIKIEYPRKYTDIVEKYAAENKVEAALIYAVIKCESGFSPDAESNIGAKGLMQITEETFNWAKSKMSKKETTTYDQLNGVEENIKYGSFILSKQLDEFGSINTALCAYHAGRGRVKGWLQSSEYSKDGKTIFHIPFNDTKIYVKRVNEALRIYRDLEKKK